MAAGSLFPFPPESGSTPSPHCLQSLPPQQLCPRRVSPGPPSSPCPAGQLEPSARLSRRLSGEAPALRWKPSRAYLFSPLYPSPTRRLPCPSGPWVWRTLLRVSSQRTRQSFQLASWKKVTFFWAKGLMGGTLPVFTKRPGWQEPRVLWEGCGTWGWVARPKLALTKEL